MLIVTFILAMICFSTILAASLLGLIMLPSSLIIVISVANMITTLGVLFTIAEDKKN